MDWIDGISSATDRKLGLELGDDPEEAEAGVVRVEREFEKQVYGGVSVYKVEHECPKGCKHFVEGVTRVSVTHYPYLYDKKIDKKVYVVNVMELKLEDKLACFTFHRINPDARTPQRMTHKICIEPDYKLVFELKPDTVEKINSIKDLKTFIDKIGYILNGALTIAIHSVTPELIGK